MKEASDQWCHHSQGLKPAGGASPQHVLAYRFVPSYCISTLITNVFSGPKSGSYSFQMEQQ